MNRIASLVCLLLICLASVSLAEPRRSSLVSSSILSGGGPRTTGVPRAEPYIQGWSVAVSPSGGLFETPAEAGGVAVDGRTRWVYAGTREGEVVCIVDGAVRWRVDVGSVVSAPPALHRELLVVPTAEGVLVSLNAVTGAIVSRAILGEELITRPVIVETFARVAALVGSSAESLFAVDLQYGQKLWRSQREPGGSFTIRGFARPAVLDGVVYAGFSDGFIQALDFETGAIRWERSLSPQAEQMDIDALATDGVRLYAASASGGVYALSLDAGTVVWRTRVSLPVSLLLDGNTVYVGAPGVLHALRSFDGKAAWRFHFGEGSASELRLTEGLIAFTELDGPLYFVDKRTGEGAGVFTPGGGFSSPPAVVGNALYVLSNGGRVYALGVIP